MFFPSREGLSLEQWRKKTLLLGGTAPLSLRAHSPAGLWVHVQCLLGGLWALTQKIRVLEPGQLFWALLDPAGGGEGNATAGVSTAGPSTLTPPWSQGPAGQPPNAMQPGCQPSSPHAAQRRGARATFGVGVGLGHSTQAGPPPRPPRVCRSLAQATPEEHLLCAALLPDQGAASAPADTQGPSPTLWPCTVPARSLGFLSVTWGDSLLLGWGVRHLLSPTAPPSQDSSPVCTPAASPSPPEPFPEPDSLLFEKQGFLTPSLAALHLLTNLPRFTRSVQGGRRR